MVQRFPSLNFRRARFLLGFLLIVVSGLVGCLGSRSARIRYPADLRYPLGQERDAVHRWLTAFEEDGTLGTRPRAYFLERSRSPFIDRELWCFPGERDRFLTLWYQGGKLADYRLGQERPEP